MKHFESIAEFENELRNFLGEEVYEKAKENTINGWMTTFFHVTEECEDFFDPELRVQCWERYLDRRMNNYDSESWSEIGFFNHGFIWQDTPEGFDFWSEINKRWYKYMED